MLSNNTRFLGKPEFRLLEAVPVALDGVSTSSACASVDTMPDRCTSVLRGFDAVIHVGLQWRPGDQGCGRLGGLVGLVNHKANGVVNQSLTKQQQT